MLWQCWLIWFGVTIDSCQLCIAYLFILCTIYTTLTIQNTAYPLTVLGIYFQAKIFDHSKVKWGKWTEQRQYLLWLDLQAILAKNHTSEPLLFVLTMYSLLWNSVPQIGWCQGFQDDMIQYEIFKHKFSSKFIAMLGFPTYIYVVWRM